MLRAVILAGGFGTRIRHLLTDLPKPMAPVNGRPFCEWVLRWLAAHGLSDFTLSTGHLAHTVSAHFDPQPLKGVSIRCRREDSPLGTAGGFLNCVDLASAGPDDTWLVANGDSLVFADPRPLISLVASGRAAAGVLGLQVQDASRYGTLDTAPDGRLLAFREKKPGASLINAGVYVFSTAAVRAMPSRRPLSFEADVFPSLVSSGSVYTHAVDAPFLDIGTPETLPAAEAFIRSQLHLFPASP